VDDCNNVVAEGTLKLSATEVSGFAEVEVTPTALQNMVRRFRKSWRLSMDTMSFGAAMSRLSRANRQKAHRGNRFRQGAESA